MLLCPRRFLSSCKACGPCSQQSCTPKAHIRIPFNGAACATATYAESRPSDGAEKTHARHLMMFPVLTPDSLYSMSLA